MNQNFYVESMPYEWFMRRAFGAHSVQTKPGVKNSYMQNLMWAEVGSANVKHLGSYDKQLVKIKKYIDKALEKYLKFKVTSEEKEQLLKIKEDLLTTYTTKELMQLIDMGLKITERFKDI